MGQLMRRLAVAFALGVAAAGRFKPFPGIGDVHTDGQGSVCVPVNYSVPR